MRELLLFFVTATMRMAGAIEKSTDVMKGMQNLIRVPEIQQSMMELSKEMSKVLHLLSCRFLHQNACTVDEAGY